MGWNISIAVNCACALRATREIGIFQIVNTWFHPYNVQMKGQLGLRRAKSTLSLLWGTRNCQTLVVTGIRALVSPGYVCVAPGLLDLWKHEGQPAVLTFAPACKWHGDVQGVCKAGSCLPAIAHSFPQLWPEGVEVAPKTWPEFPYRAPHLINCIRKYRATSAKRFASEMTSSCIGEILCSALTYFTWILGLCPRLRKQT